MRLIFCSIQFEFDLGTRSNRLVRRISLSSLTEGNPLAETRERLRLIGRRVKIYMSKTASHNIKSNGCAAGRLRRRVAVLALVTLSACARSEPQRQTTFPPAPAPAPASLPDQPKPASELVTMDVAKAVMVTVELDFGPKIPTIAEALR